MTIKPADEIGATFAIDAGRVQFGWVDQGPAGKVDPNNVRTTAFAGGFSGSTTIQGVLRKSWTNTAVLNNGTNRHREGYPLTEVTVTLQKQ